MCIMAFSSAIGLVNPGDYEAEKSEHQPLVFDTNCAKKFRNNPAKSNLCFLYLSLMRTIRKNQSRR
jgi:hypothetical protein